MREEIIREIRRLAADAGQAPGQKAFARDTGIQDHQWRGKFWARWGDALVEAGFQPNEWTGRLDSQDVLVSVIAICRHYGRVPTRDEISMYRKTDPSVPSTQAITIDYDGRISKCGDSEVRTALYEAASGLLVLCKTPSELRSWGLSLVKRRGHKKALVAVARKLATLLHRMWMDGSDFRPAAA
jgi:hypothetical protein